MQQHMDILMVLAALGVALVVYFFTKLFNSRNNKVDDIELFDDSNEPEIGNLNTLDSDQVISVRKVEEPQTTVHSPHNADLEIEANVSETAPSAVYALHVMAKPNNDFKGYELLQALLSQGLRFGEMNIFHRYQQTNGKGTPLFSLTSAVEPGTFDIHNMGAHICPGLTLFMQSSGRSKFDIERFETMVKVANNLARELDGVCLAQDRKPINEATVEQYKQEIIRYALECSESISATQQTAEHY